MPSPPPNRCVAACTPRALESVELLQELGNRRLERCQLGELRADVAADAGDRDVLQFRGNFVEAHRFIVRHAELILLESGGNVRMRPRIDVRVHAQADWCALARVSRDAVEPPELALRLDVEAHHTGIERGAHFRFALAHSGKHRLRRIPSCRDHACELPARDDVEARTEAGKEIEDREIRIRLYGVAHQRIASSEGVGVLAIGALDCGARIDVAWRAETLRDLIERRPTRPTAGRR